MARSRVIPPARTYRLTDLHLHPYPLHPTELRLSSRLEPPPNTTTDLISPIRSPLPTRRTHARTHAPDKWSPALQIRTVLLSIQALLSAPNPDDPLATDVAKHYKEDERDAQRISREWTERYAVE